MLLSLTSILLKLEDGLQLLLFKQSLTLRIRIFSTPRGDPIEGNPAGAAAEADSREGGYSPPIKCNVAGASHEVEVEALTIREGVRGARM
jgi:hypothetical protein